MGMIRQALVLGITCLLLNISALATTTPQQTCHLPPPVKAQQTIKSSGINRYVWQLAQRAYQCAKKAKLVKKTLLGVVDYSLPDSKARFWVINMKTKQVLLHIHVAQGQKTGLLYAKYFSNRINSHKSSIGLFRTGSAYYGHLGFSMRLQGLDNGFNNHAYARDIVMHGAWYVTQNFLDENHHLGRSWGCLAINPQEVKHVINLMKNGALIFSYYPDKKWLKHSKFLHCQR